MKKKTLIWLIIMFFALVAVAAFGALFFFEMFQPPVRLAGENLLVINLSGPVEENPPADFFYAYLFGTKQMTMHDFWSNLRKAAVDRKIRAVLLRLNLLECDWAKIEEMRRAVLDFRASGKKVFAYIEEGPDFDKEYYLATACDRIVLHPLGWLGINGLGGYVTFFKTTLDKLGIKAEFEHIEEYKTAYNIFTEKGFTPAHKEETESILSDIFNGYVATSAKARNLAESEFRSLIDKAFFHGQEAIEAGLVDECLYEDELELLISGRGHPLPKVGFHDYTRIKPRSLGLETGSKIALIYATGTIMPGEGFYQVLGSASLSRRLRQARLDRSVKAVVMRIDSPGGSSVASDIIWREVELTRREKPVIVSMSDLAGSGGYWIAMPASKIVAEPQTLTGSIGVLAGKFSVAGLMDKIGITTERVTFGSKADIFSPYRSLTTEERKIIRAEIEWIYDAFLDKVAQGRKMTREEVNEVGKGRVWTGRQAKEIGLVDELGGLTEAIELAKKEAGIPGDENVRFDVWPRKQTFWQKLVKAGDLGTKIPVKDKLEKSIDIIRFMSTARAWALMPLGFEISRGPIQ